jgi:hypothetical protein
LVEEKASVKGGCNRGDGDESVRLEAMGKEKKMARGRETAAGFWFQREKEMVEPVGSEK